MPPPDVPTLWSESHLESPYKQDEFATTYEQNDGILQLPLSAAVGDATAVLIQLHAPTMKKRVHFEQRRAGDIPQLALPVPVDTSNEVRASFVLAPQAPQVDSNGNQVVSHVEGEYVFYMETNLSAEDGFRMAAPPHTTIPKDLSVIRSANFVDTIL